ncbi:transporter substrate-binding domain-containing protein [Undibacterium jejuense]|uniref:Transporter substrate-binding domain-containing protein n=1 Tax=Undibacterium jejuense TaxID=1344949 RepID=A0A923KJL1_9BURK|nr:transporter substrate-binding domain-containing protein [Undibacterium jejuense]MBC3860775.1 transporter substrate-binding domain-containing protein [Undibacterium jejuense]
MRIIAIFVSLLLTCTCGVTNAAVLNACGGDNNWPPMSYVTNQTQFVKGISAEILRNIFPNKINIKLLPWARCLYQAQSQLDVDIVMSVFRTPDREQTFLFSKPYMSLTPSYLYSKKRFSSPPLKILSDLNNYKICALHGASTLYTNLPPQKIDSGATNYTSLLKKIDRTYCDIVVDMREVFAGFSALELLQIDERQYQILRIPETNKYALQFAVSKTHPQAEEIIDSLNQGLNQLIKSGDLNNLIEREGIQ